MINKRLIKNAKNIDKFLIKYLNRQNKSLLINPMKYGVISGGKKIRSTVILSAGKIFNLNQKKRQELKLTILKKNMKVKMQIYQAKLKIIKD